jgi:hypothetical protein
MNSLAVVDVRTVQSFYPVQRLHFSLDGNIPETVWFNLLPINKAA